MSDCSGDNRLIDYWIKSIENPEDQPIESEVQGVADFGNGTPVMMHGKKTIVEHGIFDDEFPEGKLVRRINFDPPVEG